MGKLIFACFIATLLLASCAAKAFKSPNFSVDKHEVAVFDPIPCIYLIEKGHNLIPNDSLSTVSWKIMNGYVSGMTDTVWNTGRGFFHASLVEDLTSKSSAMDLNKKKGSKGIPPSVELLLRATESRYGLFVLSVGFSRAKGNYTRQNFKGIGIGILTLGTYSSMPIKSRSIVTIMVFDKEAEEVVFYRTVHNELMEPTDEKQVLRQLDKVFADYHKVSR